MPMWVDNHGQNNRLDMPVELCDQLEGRVEFRGSDNYVRISAPAIGAYIQIGLGDRCNVDIGPHCMLGRLTVHGERDARVQIGAAVGFNGAVRLLLHEPAAITVGDFSIFAGDVDISVSDVYGLYSQETRARLNPPADVVLGDHVLVGARAMILKGVTIGAYSVIGAGSVVTRPVPPHCVAAGNPARVVRYGVVWRDDFGEAARAAEEGGGG
jgi:acetyltransferase-like isoleucine patch superfamily enzyme